MKKKMITLALVVFITTLLTSCGSKAYREYKDAIKTYEKAIDNATSLSQLEAADAAFEEAVDKIGAFDMSWEETKKGDELAGKAWDKYKEKEKELQ